VPRLAVLIGSVAVALALGLESAQACTCARLDVRETLSRADAAFIGILTGRRPAPPSPPFSSDVFTFRVDDVVKGTLRGSVEVWSSSYSASCGLEIGVGERIGLFLSRDGNRWTSLLCWQVSPAALREAERRPAPDGRGPVRFLVGGGFGDARLLALDARGRTLGYGSGGGATKLLSVCPRGGRAVELVDALPERVAVRDVRTLSVIREVALPAGNVAADVYCRDAGARDVYVFAKRQAGASSVIFHLRDGAIRESYLGSAQSTVFRGNSVYLNEGVEGREIVRFDLTSGARRSLATSPLGLKSLAISPRGARLAGLHSGQGSQRAANRLVVLRVDRPGPVRSVGLASSPWLQAELIWLDEIRVAVFLARWAGTVFDHRLRRLSRLKRWWAADTEVVSGVAYGVVLPATPSGQAWLQSARLPNGVTRRLRSFPGARAAVIAAVRGNVTVRSPRQLFCLPLKRVFPGS
jgi:hypothetical protein